MHLFLAYCLTAALAPATAPVPAIFSVPACAIASVPACAISTVPAVANNTPMADTTLYITSNSFPANGSIPGKYSCEGQNIHPALEVKGTPSATQTLALILDDPDAKGGFVHWVTFNIKPGETIMEGGSPGIEGNNGSGKKGYTGPCPPAGSGVHHYHFRVYALDATLDLPEGADRSQLEAAMKGHILAQGDLVGLYQKG